MPQNRKKVPEEAKQKKELYKTEVFWFDSETPITLI